MRFLLFVIPVFLFFTLKKELKNTNEKNHAPVQFVVDKEPSKPFEIFPNPVQKIFTLKSIYFSEVETELIIFDVSGKIVVKIEKFGFDKNNTGQVDIEHLSPGLYFIQLRSGNYSATKKIFKI